MEDINLVKINILRYAMFVRDYKYLNIFPDIKYRTKILIQLQSSLVKTFFGIWIYRKKWQSVKLSNLDQKTFSTHVLSNSKPIPYFIKYL